MTRVTCLLCGGLTAYGIRPDGQFQCLGCVHTIHPRDIDLDGMNVWGVASDGTLCITTDPAHSLECLTDAIEDLLTADECPNAEYARFDSIRKVMESLGAYLDARRLGIKRPEIGYTEESVRTAVNDGADMILGELGLGEPEEDAINLVVNAAMKSLTTPGATFAEMVEENYGEDPDEIRSWWGWN
ncbi:hypothetical protein [Streptomyces formicae]